jgi:hypothetical protein
MLQPSVTLRIYKTSSIISISKAKGPIRGRTFSGRALRVEYRLSRKRVCRVLWITVFLRDHYVPIYNNRIVFLNALAQLFAAMFVYKLPASADPTTGCVPFEHDFFLSSRLPDVRREPPLASVRDRIHAAAFARAVAFPYAASGAYPRIEESLLTIFLRGVASRATRCIVSPAKKLQIKSCIRRASAKRSKKLTPGEANTRGSRGFESNGDCSIYPFRQSANAFLRARID